MLTMVRIYRGGNRAGFVVDHEDVEEFVRKVEPLAAVITDALWRCAPVPEGMTELEASRRTL